MRAVMAQYLRWADGGLVSVDSCSLTHAHQGPKHLLLHYDVQVRDPVTNSLRHEVVTGVAPIKDKTTEVTDAVAEGVPPQSPDTLQHSTYMPELALLLQVFPFDQRLLALTPLLQDPAALLASHIPGDLSLGPGEIATWKAETIRYHVRHRATVRLTVEIDRGTNAGVAPRHIYAKVFSRGADAQRTFRVQQAVWEQTTRAETAFGVARPIAYVPDAQIVMFDAVPGTKLNAILRSGEGGEPAVRQAARALAGFQQLKADEIPLPPRQRPIRDEVERLRRMGQRLHGHLPSLSPVIDRIMVDINDGLTYDLIALTLFDIRPAHILIHGDQVSLLDLDKIAVADPMVDVANMMTILDKASERLAFGADRQQRLSEDFCEEYFAHVPPSWRDRLPMALALAYLTQAVRSVPNPETRSENPDWAMTATGLVRQAHEVLSGR